MVLATFDPFARDADRLARRAFSAAARNGYGPRLARMDAIRREHEVELRFDLPGVDRDSIDVTVDQGVLTVTATRSEEHAEGERPFIREREMGQSTRKVTLSDSVDADKIEAGYADGVLAVRVPLAEQAKPRKIEIRSGDEAALSS